MKPERSGHERAGCGSSGERLAAARGAGGERLAARGAGGERLAAARGAGGERLAARGAGGERLAASLAAAAWLLAACAVAGCRSGAGQPQLSAAEPSGAAHAQAEPRSATHVDAPPPTVAQPSKRPDVSEALRYDPNDPLGNLEAADVLDRRAPHSAPRKVEVPARGCVVSDEPRRVWSQPGIASLAAVGSGFVLVGYTGGASGERVFVVHVSQSGTLEPIATLALVKAHPGERVAPPGIAADGAQGVTVAYTDGSGSLFAQSLQIGAAHGGGVPLLISQAVDTRFAPAVAYGSRGPLIAFTLGTTPMRTLLVRLDAKGEVLGRHDVTPPAMGAAAPVFVSGSAPLWLVTADPRNGMSPISRTPLDSEGKPGQAQAAAPVGMMSQPPQLAAAEADFGSYVMYTGLGSAATSAVGLLRVAPQAKPPEAFVKGTAYGALHAAALGAKHVVLLAADAPISPGKQPKHEIQVALLDARGQGPLLRVPAPTGDATHVAIARGERAGIALAFSAQDGVYFAKLRCAGL